MRYVVLIALMLAIATPVHAAERGPCDDERFLRITPEEVRDNPNLVPGLIRCAAERWGVDVSTALRVAECESGMWPWAHGNANYGLFQHRGIYWPERVRLLKPDWFNEAQWQRLPDVPRGPYVARANVLVTMRMVARSGGWSAWSCA